MVGYAIGSFVGMICIFTLYGVFYKALTASLSEKITQTWKHRPARFIILVITSVQMITVLGLNLFSYYMLYKGATFTPVTEYGYTYAGESDITFAWAIFGVAMAVSVVADILKWIFILTFAD